MPPPPRRRAVSIRTLQIPADLARRCIVAELALTGAALSDAIGGGLLDDTLTDSLDGAGYCLYTDADRVAKALPDNPRAVLLAARLGWIHLVDRINLRGDILIAGTDDSGNDIDVPFGIVTAAHQAGLLPCFCTPTHL